MSTNKSQLNELCQKERYDPPNYNTIRKGGNDHAPLFACTLKISSMGNTVKLVHVDEFCHTIKDAEQSAAKLMLREIREKHNYNSSVPTTTTTPTLAKNSDVDNGFSKQDIVDNHITIEKMDYRYGTITITLPKDTLNEFIELKKTVSSINAELKLKQVFYNPPEQTSTIKTEPITVKKIAIEQVKIQYNNDVKSGGFGEVTRAGPAVDISSPNINEKLRGMAKNIVDLQTKVDKHDQLLKSIANSYYAILNMK